MSIIEIIKTVDGGIAVAVLLFVGWRAEVMYSRTQELQWHLIDKLTNGGDDDENTPTR